MNIEEKVKKAKKGDDNAFYELINENKDALYKTAYAYVKNKSDALEIIDETVYKAYLSIKKLKDESFFKTWLTRILINCSIDFMKKNKNIASYEDTVNLKADTSKCINEEKIDLYNAVDSLDLKYRTIVILKYFRDMTIPEISKVLECPQGTIKTNLHKALLNLRIKLKDGDLV